MREYRDRGIIKWAPFDALISYQSVLNAMRYERGKKEQPTLLDDQYQMLNQIITQAMRHHDLVYVTYYEDGYFKTVCGDIKAYDCFKKILIFSEGFHIKISMIVDASVH